MSFTLGKMTNVNKTYSDPGATGSSRRGCDLEKNLVRSHQVLRFRPLRNGCAVSSVVEHYLDTVGVTGSNPVSRTIFFPLISLEKAWF